MIPRTEELYQQISSMYLHDGLSMCAIAKVIGCSPPSVRNILAELGIPARHPEPRKRYKKTARRKRGKQIKGDLLWANGYAYVWMPDYHRRRWNNWAKRADVVLEEKLNRLLSPNEIAHHKNEVRSDDSADNLEALTLLAHGRIHNPKAQK